MTRLPGGSHRFWTEVVGFTQVGVLENSSPRRAGVNMRFYSGERDEGTHHHDLALIENKDLPPPPEAYEGLKTSSAINLFQHRRILLMVVAKVLKTTRCCRSYHQSMDRF